MTRMFIFAALSVFLSVPASAEMMKCTSENMAKTTTMMQSMQDGAGKMAMGKRKGNGQHGNVEGRHAERLQALHERSENGIYEWLSGRNEDVELPARARPKASPPSEAFFLVFQ